ncbi:MAG TPA: hypothetical protein VNT75_15545 [Symbiobacteriaceae bacterium]|nr:hypothetical protein [Symbiobacteriaceae bacterium]
MQKYTAVAVVSVSVVLGAITSLVYNRGDIALALIGLGSTLAVALGVGAKSQPPAKDN